MSALSHVFVASDTPEKLPDLLAGARTLGKTVVALVVGGQEDAQTATAHGADTVCHFAPQQGVPYEDYAASMAQVIRETSDAGLVLLPANRRGKCLGAKLAARLGTALVNDADSITVESGAVMARHMVYGGMAFETRRFTTPLAVVSVGGGVFGAAPSDPGRAGNIVPAAFVAVASPIRRGKVRAKEGSSVDLAKAKRVLSVGRGLKSREDIALMERLAKAIGAEVGCTRPIAESEHWMESERYIGVSGVMLKNDVFFCIGVSGQIQHMVGASACKTIISINKDKNAPVFKFTDYGIIGDLYTIVPKLINAFEA